MCCSWRRTSFGDKSRGINTIGRVRQIVRRSRIERTAFSPFRHEGNWRAFSFYEEGSQLGLDTRPAPSAMCLRPTGYKGPLARDGFASRLRFPNRSSASSRGRTTQRFFVLRNDARLGTTRVTAAKLAGRFVSPAAVPRELRHSRPEPQFPEPRSRHSGQDRKGSRLARGLLLPARA
jgi:hypothetical protein